MPNKTKGKSFKWAGIDGSDSLLAEWTTWEEHQRRVRRSLKNGLSYERFTYLLEVRQLGFFGSRSIVVARSTRSGKTWVFNSEEDYLD